MFDAVQLGRSQQALDRSSTAAGALWAGKQPVFLTRGDWPDDVLDWIIVDR